MNTQSWGWRVALAVGLASAACSSGGGGGGGGHGASSAPAAPQMLVALPGAAEVTLSWNTVSGASSYTLYWSTGPGVTPAGGTPIAGVTSPHVHGTLGNGTAYYYVVTASNAAGEGPPSSEQSATPYSGATGFDPPWAQVAPAQTIQFTYDVGKSSQQNGADLKVVIGSLQPGTRLEIGAGVYRIDSFFSINLVGTAAAPIWIAARAGDTPVLTRSDAAQNVVNVGSGGAARYLALQGLEITGGDTALRLWNCQNVWVDACHIHDCGGIGIEANSNDTAWLYITRNEIHGTAGMGEGIYLGANDGAVVTHDSVVALNHVHHTGGSQGDGIELKQGSYGNRIVANLVHDTQYPGILVYGTGGGAFNLIERNTVYNSGDNVLQVQGEAVVRNNLLMNGEVAFASGDHQGQVRDLTVVHNTMINTLRAVNLSDWANRPNVTFANNAAYSQNGEAVKVNGGSAGIEFAGNVTYGPVAGIVGGFVTGTGLGDFVDVTWNATKRDATPVALGAIIGSGDFLWAVPDDITAAPRSNPLEAGCHDGP